MACEENMTFLYVKDDPDARELISSMIAISSNSDTDHLLTVIEIGLNLYILKPVDYRKLSAWPPYSGSFSVMAAPSGLNQRRGQGRRSILPWRRD
jgi:response regulator of citrate/malate metabolism